MKIGQYKLVKTSNHCPEQYDVKDKKGNLVGWLHYRGDSFCANAYTKKGGYMYIEVLRLKKPAWDEYGRLACLTRGVRAIHMWFSKIEK